MARRSARVWRKSVSAKPAPREVRAEPWAAVLAAHTARSITEKFSWGARRSSKSFQACSALSFKFFIVLVLSGNRKIDGRQLTSNRGKEKNKDLTQRPQREEHRGHGENENAGRMPALRNRHDKSCPNKEKAPTGAGAHFSTLIILLYRDRLVKDKMRYCKLLIGGTLSRLRARACYSVCRKIRAAGNTASTGDLCAACPESVRSLNRYAVEGGPRQFGVVVAADGQADEDVRGHGDGLAGAHLGPVQAIGRSIAGEGAAAAHQLDPVGQSNRGRVARRT